MASCPNCGNHWDESDEDNAAAADAGQRQPIILIDFVNQELDESIMRSRCTACRSEWTGTYKARRLKRVDMWHLVGGVKPKHRD